MGKTAETESGEEGSLGNQCGENIDLSTTASGLWANSTNLGNLSPVFSPGLLDAGCKLLHEVVDTSVLLDELCDLGRSVDDSSVVTTPKLLPDLRKRGVCKLTAEVHSDLSRVDDCLRTLVASQLLE